MNIAIITRDGAAIGIAETTPALGALSWFHSNVHAYSMDHALKHEGYAIEEREPDCGEVEALINAICARSSVSMSAVFVPFSQSHNAKQKGERKEPWRSLNWRVTIKRTASGDVLTTDYSQGEGYAPAYKAKETAFRASQNSVQVARQDAIAWEIENGKVARVHSFGTMGSKAIPAPSIGEVMQSLARDSDVLDAGGFEEWAGNLGYDPDSRAAEAIYKECLEIALKLRRGLGDILLTELRLAAGFN